MNLPDIPPVFKQPAGVERSWWWEFVDAQGTTLPQSSVAEEYADQRFANQGDAESWVGEVWAELLDQGVEAVVLKEEDRSVYGPMSLRA